MPERPAAGRAGRSGAESIDGAEHRGSVERVMASSQLGLTIAQIISPTV
jgi:hypothetical protein